MKSFSKISHFISRLKTYFMTGVLVTAPLGLTIYIIWFIIDFFDRSMVKLLPEHFHPDVIFPFTVPGIGVIFFIFIFVFIGFLTANYIGRQIIYLGQSILETTPIIRGIFGAIKQIFETLFSQNATAFRQVVLVEFPRKNCWALGFVTAETREEIKNLHSYDVLSIFIATTPNPTSGFFMFYDKKDVYPLKMTPEEGIKMVISGGIITPPDKRSKEEKQQSIIVSQSSK